MPISTAESAIPARPATLRVLSPAPQSQRTAGTLTPGRPGLFTALDLMNQSIGIYTGTGILMRQTHAYERFVDDAGDRDVLLRLVRAAIEEVAAGISRRGTGHPPAVCLRNSGYEVRASQYQPAEEPLVLVYLSGDSGSFRPLTDRALRDRYGLTPAELRVARLVGDGKSNKVVAASLALSEHTTRHHTERVLRKLGVHSRSEVARKLLSEG
jgi:DNA-binding CsgD family transcriptional regulator